MKEDELWDQFFSEKERRDSRVERKRLQKKDRSQFKKTDADKAKGELPEGERGQVIEICADLVWVATARGIVEATLKGALKAQSRRMKHLITVGDCVRLDFSSSPVIVGVEPRRTVLARSENLDRQKRQLIAANIDQVIITLSVFQPALSPPLIERYLIAAEKGNMEAVIVINKVDVERPDGYAAMMRKLGYRIILTSIKTGEGIAELKEAMQGKTSVFSGPSGVGKSSLINVLLGTDLKVGESSAFSGKGRHTTTTTRLVPMEGGGFCLDTPGIRSFGIWELAFEDVLDHFFEIKESGLNCRFATCRHRGEEGCNVLDDCAISDTRLTAYRALVDELDQTHKRR